MKRFAMLLPALMMAGITVAQDEESDQPTPSDAPPPPPIREPMPPKVQDPDEQIAPQVVIRREDDRMIEEYSSDGQIYMVKITPLGGGPSYYLIDTDGDGELESRHEHMEPVMPAYWKIAEW
ncbi:DUF2782 domain-containing protein [Wenzhouxiangella sp. XN201]|uniref:DUF2782 domain-containing protein n=1 Tax=Wenzhouxiangella sp. XN201 TaxID=2710755 RepID=UPI00196A01C1|nr:DUF2782 domain-containing protein [Wenzhouxiangella sp. XN201]